MIFWTLFFFTISFYGVFKGSIFTSSSKKMIELNIRVAEGGDKEEITNYFLKEGFLPWVSAVFIIIAEIWYLIHALSITGISKYLTIAALMLCIITMIISFSKKKYADMSQEELNKEKEKLKNYKNVTLRSFINSVLWSAYYGYMFYVLVF
jgi:ABC-type transport system involved in cytochrome bd biosynthesis fused ATPase/permease subunit